MSISGFIVEENRIIPEADIPSYNRLAGGNSLKHLRTSPLGRWLGCNIIWLLEKTRIFSRGSAGISDVFQNSANSLVRACRLDIFTSLFFFLARKPSL